MHPGTLPGQMSMLFMIPSEGIGVMVAHNVDTLDHDFLDVVAYTVMDELLALHPVDWEEKILLEGLRKGEPSYSTAGGKGSTPPRDVGGKYRSPGHGEVRLIPLRSASPNLIEALSIGPLGDIDVTGPNYLATIQRTFISHLVFSHFEGDVFDWTALWIFPVLDRSGEKTSEMVGTVYQTGLAVFEDEQDGGFGLFGTTPGGQSDLAKEKAEVWFERVKD